MDLFYQRGNLSIQCNYLTINRGRSGAQIDTQDECGSPRGADAALYYRAALQAAVDTALARYKHCLITDRHSFNSVSQPHEPDPTLDRLELCRSFDDLLAPLTKRIAANAARLQLHAPAYRPHRNLGYRRPSPEATLPRPAGPA